MKAKNKEDLAYDDDQELKETREDIKHSDVMLGETEKKVIEDFMSLIEDLEQPEKDLMIESSNKTIKSCEFTVDKVNVFAGYGEYNLSFEVVLSEVGGWKARWDEECLAGEDTDEVLQQKEIENSLSSDEGNTN